MKNRKLKLADLKVNSFITEISKSQVKGGADLNSIICLTGMYPTLPVQGCTQDYSTQCFTNNLTQQCNN